MTNGFQEQLLLVKLNHDFYFKDNSAFRIICYELNEDSKHLANWRIKLDVIINSKVFNEFLGN